MPARVHQILESIHEWAPPETKMDYDNVGLLVGSKHKPVSNILVCLDVTQAIVDEAIEEQAELIVAHHPLIFRKLSSISSDDEIGSIIYSLIKNDIAVIAAHTNLDAAQYGVSFRLADKLDLKDIDFLSADPQTPNTGMGATGRLPAPMKRTNFLEHISATLKTKALRFSGIPEEIETVAVCGGAGTFLIEEAHRAGADAFVTADVKYHDYFPQKRDLLLVDAGHYETEIPIVKSLKEYLETTITNTAVTTAATNTNPMNIFISQTSKPEPDVKK